MYADELRDRGIEVSPEPKFFSEMRRTKTEKEISHIEKTQRAVEAACARAVEIVGESNAREYGNLFYGDNALTSEFLRSEIEIELLKHGCAADAGTITAGGSQSRRPARAGPRPAALRRADHPGHLPREQGESLLRGHDPDHRKRRAGRGAAEDVRRGPWRARRRRSPLSGRASTARRFTRRSRTSCTNEDTRRSSTTRKRARPCWRALSTAPATA